MITRIKKWIIKPAERNAYMVASEYLRKEANAMGIVDPAIRAKLESCANRTEEHAKSIK